MSTMKTLIIRPADVSLNPLGAASNVADARVSIVYDRDVWANGQPVPRVPLVETTIPTAGLRVPVLASDDPSITEGAGFVIKVVVETTPRIGQHNNTGTRLVRTIQVVTADPAEIPLGSKSNLTVVPDPAQYADVMSAITAAAEAKAAAAQVKASAATMAADVAASKTAATQAASSAAAAAATDVAKVTSDVTAISKLASGYVTQTITASTTLAVTAGTYDLTVSADATLTMSASNGTAVTLIVRPATGKTLTIAGTNTIGGTAAATAITTASMVTLLKTADGWGGITQAASTGGTGSTDPGTTTPPATGGTTTVATLDLTGVADGTKLTTLIMSNGATFTNTADPRLIVQGGWIGLPVTPGDETFTAAGGGAKILLPKEQVTLDYDFGGGWERPNSKVELSLGVNGALDNSVTLVLAGDGQITNGSSVNYQQACTIPAAAQATKTGSLKMIFDSTTGKATGYLNGTLIYTNILASYDTSKKCGGWGLTVRGSGTPALGRFKNVVVSAVA